MNETKTDTTGKPVELMNFLLYHTPVKDLCVVRQSGYIRQVIYIDHEDLFLVHPMLQQMPVKSHRYGTLTVKDEAGHDIDVPCHYVDV